MNLREATNFLAFMYRSFPVFRNHEWEGELNSPNEIYVAAFRKDSPELVASISFQNFDTDTIEFGFDVYDAYRNQVIATEFMKGMIQTAHVLFPGKNFVIRTDVTHAAYRRVAKKCGDILAGYEPTFASKVIMAGMKLYGNKLADDVEQAQLRTKNAEFIEEDKEDVCVYRLE